MRQFFGQLAEESSEVRGREVVKMLATSTAVCMLFYYLEEVHKKVDKRKGCKGVLRTVADESLKIRGCILEKAQKAMKMMDLET